MCGDGIDALQITILLKLAVPLALIIDRQLFTTIYDTT